MPFVKGSLNFFNHKTNVDINDDLIIADIYELGEENLKYGLFIFTDYFWDLIKKEFLIKILKMKQKDLEEILLKN